MVPLVITQVAEEQQVIIVHTMVLEAKVAAALAVKQDRELTMVH
jgi:hypothetical protein